MSSSQKHLSALPPTPGASLRKYLHGMIVKHYLSFLSVNIFKKTGLVLVQKDLTKWLQYCISSQFRLLPFSFIKVQFYLKLWLGIKPLKILHR